MAAFQQGATAIVSDSLASEEYVRQFSEMEELLARAKSFCPDPSPAMLASAAEFILEGLYLHRLIHKESVGAETRYKG